MAWRAVHETGQHRADTFEVGVRIARLAQSIRRGRSPRSRAMQTLKLQASSHIYLLERFKIAFTRCRVTPIIFAKSCWLSLGTGPTSGFWYSCAMDEPA